MINEIQAAIKTYARGLISEKQCIELIQDIISNNTVPVIDVFGLGPTGDPEAYGLPRRSSLT